MSGEYEQIPKAFIEELEAKRQRLIQFRWKTTSTSTLS